MITQGVDTKTSQTHGDLLAITDGTHPDESAQDSLWLNFKGIEIFKPCIAPWQSFVAKMQALAASLPDSNMAYGFNFNEDTKSLELALIAFDQQEKPQFSVHLAIAVDGLRLGCRVNEQVKTFALDVTDVASFEKALNQIYQNCLQGFPKLETSLVNEVEEADIASLENTSEAVMLKPQQEAVSKAPTTDEPVAPPTSTTGITEPSTQSNSLLNWLTHPYAQLLYSLGMGCLLYVYGKPFAAIAGRQLVTHGYDLIYGEPEIVSNIWEPVRSAQSLYEHKNYLAAREHVGHYFYNNAEYIFPPVGSLLMMSTFYTLGKVKDIGRYAYKHLLSTSTLPAPAENEAPLDEDMKQITKDMAALSLDEPNQMPTQAKKIIRAKSNTGLTRARIGSEENEFALVPVSRTKHRRSKSI